MKASKCLCSIILLLSLINILFAQENPKPELINKLSATNCEQLLAWLDQLAIKGKDTASTAYVVVKYGDNAITNLFYTRWIRSFPVSRKISPKMFQVLVAKSTTKELEIEFWLSKDGPPPISNERVSLALTSKKRRPFILKAGLEISKHEDEWDYFDWGCIACCIETIDMGVLGQILEANPDFNATVIIENLSKKGAATTLWLLRSEIDSEKISRNRFKIIYKIKRPEFSDMGSNFSNVSIWLVPIKSKRNSQS